jgi:hypothetical protein
MRARLVAGEGGHQWLVVACFCVSVSVFVFMFVSVPVCVFVLSGG